MVKTLPSSAEGTRSIPGRGTKIPNALGPESQNIKQKQYCNKFNKDKKKKKNQIKNLSNQKIIVLSKRSYNKIYQIFQKNQCEILSVVFSLASSSLFSPFLVLVCWFCSGLDTHLLGWCLIPELLVSLYLNTLIVTWLWSVCWLDPMLLILSGTGGSHTIILLKPFTTDWDLNPAQIHSTWLQDLVKLGFLMSDHRKNSVRDKVVGIKWIYSDSERSALHRQCGPSQRGVHSSLGRWHG